MEIYPNLEDLMQQYPVQGAAIYDARIVAAMLSHGVSDILTHNVRHFQPYADRINLYPLNEVY